MDAIADEAMADDNRLPADVESQPLVRAAAGLQPLLRELHDEIEREQRFPRALVEKMREAGLYRMVIPRSLGGYQADALTYLRAVELMAEGCGSVGWNLANNGIVQLVSLGLPDGRPGRRAGGAGRGRLPRHRPLELWQRLPGGKLDARQLPDPR